MRKQLLTTKETETSLDALWFDLDSIAIVQVTSEQEGYPIEQALIGEGEGWRASSEGTQTIRLIFDKPQKLTRIWIVFEEAEHTRTQEFVLRWSADNGKSFREIVRQQWNFSAPNSTREAEDYKVGLDGVTIFDLSIVPNMNGGDAHASLACLRLA